ncbi:hypothetical protein EAH88_18670 [Rhodanobacter glycinis]|uniref:SIR2-like domain-containing protein n=1 Tax=Rhodanobacter glycinis TaxID=582702 RepID=A0A502BUE5_9GAMM|nr:SIR2 family protein [Rhodanobacter glycinis]TPG04133.1 hypothetical protein EAH88_18670 [Rhodanobacter glycinis]
MSVGTKKRAVVLMGAGAGLHLGAPRTRELTDHIRASVAEADYHGQTVLQDAFQEIEDRLAEYLEQPSDVNFEHIYHVVHELLKHMPHTKGAVNEFRPLLSPFFTSILHLDERVLHRLATAITDAIFACLTAASMAKPDTTTLATFIKTIRVDHTLRLYTTNYDDLVLQAAPDLYTGFVERDDGEPGQFDVDNFYQRQDTDGAFYLHGSVHFGFPPPNAATKTGIGEIRWFRDPSVAKKFQNGGTRSEARTMDGMSVLRSTVVTGLDKLNALQAIPMAHFYQAFAQDVMLADIIYVIGSGLSDLHLNVWLGQARSRSKPPVLVFVDFWVDGYEMPSGGRMSNKDVELFHRLKVHATREYSAMHPSRGWTIAGDKSAAIWDRGFDAFLKDPAQLHDVLALLV